MTKQERLSAVFFLAVGVAVIYYGISILKLGSIQEPGPGFFPTLCGVGIIFLCLQWLIFNPLAASSEPLWGTGEWIAPVMAMVIVFAYAAGMETMGYVVSTLLFLIAWQVLVEKASWKRTGIIAFVGTAVMYVLFSFLLGVPLPEGLLL